MTKKYAIENKEAGKIKIVSTINPIISEKIVDISHLQLTIDRCDDRLNGLKEQRKRVESARIEAETDLAEAKKLLK